MADAFNLQGDISAPVQMQGGSVRKNATFIDVPFPQPFPGIPVVLLTPYWAGQNQEVRHVNTLADVKTTGFTVGSENVADNYFLQWIAVFRQG